jgi:hypothetical protein
MLDQLESPLVFCHNDVSSNWSCSRMWSWRVSCSCSTGMFFKWTTWTFWL